MLSHDENLSRDVRSHDELRPERDGNGQEMVKCDIRIVFHKVRFRKMSQTDPVLNANRAPGMHLLQNPGRRDGRRTTTDEQRNYRGPYTIGPSGNNIAIVFFNRTKKQDFAHPGRHNPI